MGRIVVDRGLEEFEIVDKKGNLLGKFEMNPADLEMIKRYQQVSEALEHIGDGLDEKDSFENVIEKAEKKVYEQIDYLFNAEVAKDFFAITSPFTTLKSGDFYIENVINAIGGLIEQETGKRYKKIRTKMNTYTDKYHD